jgi:tetratricopeptide (TPR) repeat protein
MPSHIYINTGDYHLGSLSNIRAVEVDSTYTTACHAQGVYPLSYYPHNYHFLAATATLEGNSKLAYASAHKLKKQLSTDIMRMPGWGTLQHYSTIPYFIAVKFALWDSILALPSPEKDLIYPRAIWHYARGLAFLGKKDIRQAEQEWNNLSTLSNDSSLLQLTIWGINTTADIAHIAAGVLAGEIAASKGDNAGCINMLKEAITIEDQLNYDEPPDWFFSVRHHLGAIYIKAGKYQEAEKTYQEDLKKLKRNGWGLLGLHQALKGQGKDAAANETLKEFENAWQYADVRIYSSSPLK